MKSILLANLILLCSLSVFSQDQPEPVLTLDGKPLVFEKGWNLIKQYTDKNNRVTAIFTYQSKSVVKSAPGTFKFWLKIKNYADLKEDYGLIFYEVRCNAREVRTSKIIHHYKNSTSKTVENPDLKFEDVEPDSLDEMVFSAICKKYNTPN